MKATFLGAAGEVTGSATLVETGSARVLVDFGSHQGSAEIDRRNRSHTLRRLVPAGSLDAVVLTHAHLDHCGRLPMLEASGLAAPIACTPSTAELTPIVLRDSAAIQESDAERARRHGRPDRDPPLFGREEAERSIARLVAQPFGAERTIAPGVSLRFVANAHILGSACALLTVRDGDRSRRLLFSGDIGHVGVTIARAPDPPPPCDVLVLESTYGDRDHRAAPATFEEFAAIVEDAVRAKGVVLVPAFAIGRAQTILWMVSEAIRTRGLPQIPVILDSPMAVDVTRIHERWRSELLNEEGRRRLAEDGRLLLLDDLRQVRESEQSRRLNDIEGPAVIVSPSGMCTGGRILHHLLHHVWKPTTTVLIVGYQAAGTIGRALVDGATEIEVFGEPVRVRARVRTLNGLSAHAGRSELVRWAGTLRGAAPRLFLNHGEERPRQALAAALQAELGVVAGLPRWEESVEV